MGYLTLKFIHVVSSTILFGTGIGTAAVMVYAHRTRNMPVIAAVSNYVVFADWVFTTSSAVIQFFTGVSMVLIAGYPWTLWWVWGSLLGYIVAGSCWLPVVYLQIQMHRLVKAALQKNEALPLLYHRYFKIWFCLGWPAFLSLLVVFYLMTVKPG